jgi:hypothetical protein
LQALEEQTTAPTRVIVVGRLEDPASLKAFMDWKRRTPLHGDWVSVGEPGHIPPIRAGLGEATSDLVAFLDDDAEPLKDWLAYLVAPFADPTVSCVGGQFVTGSVSDPHERITYPRDAGRVRWYGRFVGDFGSMPGSGPVEADGVVEGTSCWRRSQLQSLRFTPIFSLDDSLYYGLDLTFQSKALGQRVLYEYRARAVHHTAPRDGVVARSDRAARAHIAGRNYTYLGLRWFRGFRRPWFIIWWMLIGDRQSYGLLKGAWDLLLHPAGTWEALRAAWRGRLEGWRTWRRELRR